MMIVYLIAFTHIVAGMVLAAAWLRPQNRTEHLLKAALCCYVTFYMIPIGIGWVTGVMNSLVIFAAASVTTLFATVSYVRGERSAWHLWRPAGNRWQPRGEWLIWGITALALIAIYLVGAALPARSYDAAAYHMLNPMRWHLTGKFILDSFGEASLHPQIANAECAPNMKAVLPFVILRFTGNEAGTALAQFPFLIILVLCTRAMAIRLGARGWLASLAALGVCTIPEVFFQSTEAYADLVFVCGQMVMIWSLLALWQSGYFWRSIMPVLAGLAIFSGAKSAFVVSGAILTVVAMGVVVIISWQEKWVARTIRPLLLGALAVLTVVLNAGPWVLNAWSRYDNPLYPFKVTIGEKEIFAGQYALNVNEIMLKGLTGTDGWQAYWNTLHEHWRYPIISNWAGGLGSTFFIVGIPALVVMVFVLCGRGRYSGTRRLLLICLAGLFVATPTYGIARFILYHPVAGLVAFAVVAGLVPAFPRFVWSAMLLATMGYDVFMNVSAVQYRQRPAFVAAYHLLSGQTSGAMKDTFPDQYTALDFWREEVSGPDKLLAVPPRFHVWLAYSAAMPGDIVRVREPQGPWDMQQWLHDLQGLGVTHIYLRKTDKAFDWMQKHLQSVRVLMRRVDGHFAPRIHNISIDVWPEDILLELKAEADD